MIEVPLTAGRSVAMDYRIVPRGGLVWFETNWPAGSREEGEGPAGIRLRSRNNLAIHDDLDRRTRSRAPGSSPSGHTRSAQPTT